MCQESGPLCRTGARRAGWRNCGLWWSAG